jgi:DNA (cytosine-5)-methyltransferase 1
MNQNKITFIDLFAGAGGLSEGFLRNDFCPVAHVEMSEDACSTLKTRLAYYYLKKKNNLSIYFDYLLGKVTREQLYSRIPKHIIDSVFNYEMSNANLKDIFKKIHLSLTSINCETVDLILGGPPCQAYSMAGRSADKDRKKHDLRNFLYRLYARFLIEFKPKMFVFENVPGLLSAEGGKYYKNMKKYFRRIGYSIEDRMVDASVYGVLQKRRRILIIGWYKRSGFEYSDPGPIDNNWTVDDLLYDLPPIKAGGGRKVCKYSCRKNEYLTKFQIRNGVNFVTQHIARPHNNNDLDIYRMVIERWEREGRRLLNSEIPKHKRTQKNIHSFLDRFKVVAGDRLSHTLLAHIAKDGHYYIHPDKKQLRSLSIREAARIQSFPDDYFFEGSRTSIFKQIGNAVPPLMAGSIAKKIKDIIQ